MLLYQDHMLYLSNKWRKVEQIGEGVQMTLSVTFDLP